ncbi:MAG TPA: penicillin acylase family protein [Steroidobacteraceae bacterium]|nr:penicillin acylase family protein [Steroidobacteraceae bacterium]
MKYWALMSCALIISGASLPTQADTAPAISSAVSERSWTASGLKAPADIVIDHWGIAHIFAANIHDAFFLQGYNAARDRLWQIDLWRKRGLGLLAKSLGPAYVDQDRAARLFLYRGDMDKEWAAYAPESRQWVTAFVDGVNAYVAQVRSGDRPLPIEFRLTGSQPANWQADDVLRIRSHALVSNVTSEVARARVVCAAGLKADALRRKIEPQGHKVTVPSGLNPCDVPADVLKDYLLATKQVDFNVLAGTAQHAGISAERQLASAMDAQSMEGSNNWAIAPSHTETGRPILANDPHRQLGAPSLRYIVALSAPGLNIIGAGEPALPGISLGHNDDIAFGITIFAIDQEDLYVYELKKDDPDSYRYKSGWEKVRIVHESIEVKGAAARDVELRFTRHGPVIASDAAKHRAFAMRTVWNEPGLAGYFGSSRLLMAKNWNEFKAAGNAWGAPPLNIVYADTQGNIGWAASGRVPKRKNWDGLMPVPGDGRYEWDGFYGKDVLPSVFNPAEGYFATANEMNLPSGYPNEENRIAFEWNDRSRIDRINELLRAKTKMTLADSMAIQTDAVSTQSRRAVALLASLSSNDAEIAEALSMLKAWDHDESTASPAAAIYEVWATKHLGKATIARATPEAAHKLIDNPQLQAVVEFLEHPDGALGADPAGARDAILVQSLKSALTEISQRLGPDMTTWAWGRLHRATFEPAVAVLADPQLRAQMSVGPLETPGSSSTPRAQSYRAADFSVASGASVRLVMDVGAWDNSVAMNSPGQSDDPMNAHYRDLFPMWAQGSYVPLRFSRAAVDADAEDVIHLSPSR